LAINLFEVQAQSGCAYTMSGKVVTTSGEVAVGASVLLTGTNTGQQADIDGKFSFTGLCAGHHVIVVKLLGYADQSVRITLPQSATVVVKLASDDKVLEEIVVQEHLSHTEDANTFQSLEGRALDETRGKSLGEALQSVSGVSTIQTGPSIFKPVIHGLHSQRILILNNGVRQEGQQWGADHAPEIDPFIASNIVVIKDAAAIKYGTDALGGVVVVNPPDLPAEPGLGGELSMVGQTNGRSGTMSGYLQGGSKRLKGFGWRVQGTGKKAGDFKSADYILSNTGFNELNFSAATGYHANDLGVELFFSHFQSELGVLRGSTTESLDDLKNALEREPPQYTSDFSYSIKNPKQQVRHDLLKLSIHKHIGSNNYRVQYGFQSNARKEFDVRRGDLNALPSINLKLYTHTLDAEMEHTGSRLVQTIGVNGIMQDNSNIEGTKRIPFIPNFNNLSAGAFLIEKLTLERWTLDAGVRYDYRDYKVSGFDYKNAPYKASFNFHSATFSVGATHHFTKTTQFITSLGAAWRPPHVSELYSFGQHQSAGGVEYGLLITEGENVKNVYDAGFRNERALKWVNTYRYQKDKIAFEATAYYNYIFNYIYLQPSGITRSFNGYRPYFFYRQTDASFLGADVAASYDVLATLRLDTRISTLRVTDERHTDDYLVFIPANRYELGARYELPTLGTLKNFYIEPRVKYTDKQRRAPGYLSVDQLQTMAESGESLPTFDFAPAPDAYFMVTLFAGVRVPFEHSSLDLRAGVTNALNTKYRDYTNRMRYYADEMGRNFTLAVRYAF